MGFVASLADSLAKVLAPEVQVFDGVVLEMPKGQGGSWTGKLEWLLLIQGYLLRLVGEVKDKTLTVSHVVYPLSTLRHVAIVTGYQEAAGTPYFHSYALVIEFLGGKIEARSELPSDTADHLVRFGQRLLTP